MEANESNPGERDWEGDEAMVSRVQRIEESLAFAEHAIEELSAEVSDLSAQFTRMRLRLEALDRLVRSPKEAGDGTEPSEEPG